jgi:hypothetical protein
MVSSKGKPTDPKLREKVKEDVKNETNKDGGGKGQWSAWKVSPYRVLYRTLRATDVTLGRQTLERVREEGRFLRERIWIQERTQEGHTAAKIVNQEEDRGEASGGKV